MIDFFKIKAEGAGSEVYRFPDEIEALSFILDFLKKEGIAEADGPTAVWADGPFLTRVKKSPLLEKVPGLRFDVTRETAGAAKIGISQMEWAIAATGTLAQDSTKAEQRMASSLPLIHIALLDAGTIVADLPALMAKMHPSQSNYIALISGPSKTADIERVLAIGVHGPERVVVVCVDTLGGMNP